MSWTEEKTEKLKSLVMGKLITIFPCFTTLFFILQLSGVRPYSSIGRADDL